MEFFFDINDINGYLRVFPQSFDFSTLDLTQNIVPHGLVSLVLSNVAKIDYFGWPLSMILP